MAGNQDKFQESMNQGHSAAWDQAWEKAAGFYLQALEEFPDHPGALTSAGLAMFELGEYNRALGCYRKAASITPEDPIPLDKIARIHERLGAPTEAVPAYLKAAELYVKSREVDKAIECWNRALGLKPDHLNARTRLAMVHERRGKKEEAVEEYLATASIMQHQGDTPRALQVVEYCLQIQPDSIKAKNALAQLKSNQSLPKLTRLQAESAPARTAPAREVPPPTGETKSLSPVQEAHKKALVRIASLLFDQAEQDLGDRTTQRKDLAAITRGAGADPAALPQSTQALVHLGQAIDAQTRGDDNQTVAELERTLEGGLHHPAIHFLLGEIYTRKEPVKSIKRLQSAAAHIDYSLAAHLLLGSSQARLDNYSEAAASYLRALAAAETVAAPAGQADEIRQAYEPMIESQMHQEDQAALQKLCRNLEEQLNRPDWQSHLLSLRRQLPEGSDTGFSPLGDLLLSSSSHMVETMTRIRRLAARSCYDSAVEEAFFTLDKAPSFLPLHVLIGEILLQQGKVQEAVNKFTLVAGLYRLRGEGAQGIRMLERITSMAPMNLKIRGQLIDLLINQGEVLAAVEQLKQVAGIYYQLAELDKAQQAYADAVRLVQQSHADRSVLLDLLHRKADIDLQRLDFRQAIRVFEQIRTIEPQDTRARIRLVDLYFRLGQDHNAIAEIDDCISLLEDGGKRAEVLQFLQEAVAEVPDKLEIRKRLADQLLRQGSKAEAIEQLDFIADALLQMGNRESALRVLKTIIALKPPNVSEYQEAYSQLNQG